MICPIGFVCDHIEVLYDLDHEAAAICREIGLPMARAEAVNDDPLFLDMMADVVHEDRSALRAGKAAADRLVTVRLSRTPARTRRQKPDTTAIDIAMPADAPRRVERADG